MSNSSVSPWTVACQVLLSMGFPRQVYCSGWPLSSLWDLPKPRMELSSPEVDSLPLSQEGSPLDIKKKKKKNSVLFFKCSLKWLSSSSSSYYPQCHHHSKKLINVLTHKMIPFLEEILVIIKFNYLLLFTNYWRQW